MSINIEITTPKEISFKGSCYMVILPTISGEVGIMQGHESFVSRLCEGEIKLYNQSEEIVEIFKITGGFCKINDYNNLSILTDE